MQRLPVICRKYTTMHSTVLCGNEVILQTIVLTDKITFLSLQKVTHYQWVSCEVLQS